MKRIIALFAITTLAGLLVYIPASYAADPIEISTCSELAAIDDDPAVGFDADYFLPNDIDCTGVTMSSLVWTSTYSGIFDGQGHRIRNLTINEPSFSRVGLFNRATSATIKNLILDGGSITGLTNVGALVGASSSVVIDNVHSNLDVTGSGFQIGGLLGNTVNSVVTNSSSSGDVTGAADNVGGLIGKTTTQASSTTVVSYSWATGVVEGTSGDGLGVGGLIGDVEGISSASSSMTNIHDVYAQGDVIGETSFGVGGLIGSLTLDAGAASATIWVDKTYATGAVTGIGVGGLLGSANGILSSTASPLVNRSFSTGLVTGSGGVGGLVGTQGGDDHALEITNSTWEISTSGQSNCMSPGAATCTGHNGDIEDWFGNETLTPMDMWSFNGSPWYTRANSFPVLNEDLDFDAIDNEEEDGGPNGGDANDDGILDADQQTVKTFNNYATNNYVTISTPDGAAVGYAYSTDGSGFAGQDDEFTYSHGFFSFVIVCEVGATINVELYLQEDIEADTLAARKYNPDTHDYTTIEDATQENISYGDTDVLKVSYSLTDGGEFDADDDANGQIYDPVGLGAAVIPTATTTTTTTTPGQVGNEVTVGNLPTTGAQISSILLLALLFIAGGFLLNRKFRTRNP